MVTEIATVSNIMGYINALFIWDLIFSLFSKIITNLSKNISNLSTVYNLNVSYCPLIEIFKTMNSVKFNGTSTNLIDDDIQYLKNIKILVIKKCFWISDLSILNNVEILDISGCKNIKKLPTTSHLKTLNISANLHNISSIYLQTKYMNCEIDIDYFN